MLHAIFADSFPHFLLYRPANFADLFNLKCILQKEMLKHTRLVLARSTRKLLRKLDQKTTNTSQLLYPFNKLNSTSAMLHLVVRKVLFAIIMDMFNISYEMGNIVEIYGIIV